MHKCASPSTPMWSTDSRRIDPINLSGKADLASEPGCEGAVKKLRGHLFGD
jgi:hypothetical protein